jgi:hypothetical protein
LCICSRWIKQHIVPTQRRFIRNSNKQEFDEGKLLIFTGEEEQYDESAFIAVEVKAGKIAVTLFI